MVVGGNTLGSNYDTINCLHDTSCMRCQTAFGTVNTCSRIY